MEIIDHIPAIPNNGPLASVTVKYYPLHGYANAVWPRSENCIVAQVKIDKLSVREVKNEFHIEHWKAEANAELRPLVETYLNKCHRAEKVLEVDQTQFEVINPNPNK